MVRYIPGTCSHACTKFSSHGIKGAMDSHVDRGYSSCRSIRVAMPMGMAILYGRTWAPLSPWEVLNLVLRVVLNSFENNSNFGQKIFTSTEFRSKFFKTYHLKYVKLEVPRVLSKIYSSVPIVPVLEYQYGCTHPVYSCILDLLGDNRALQFLTSSNSSASK